MNGIFISYRRDDAQGWAGRLADSLRHFLGRVRVFRDIDDIPPGADFDSYIRENVTSCSALVVMIGPNWLVATDAQGCRRLDDPNDFIRIEIATALEKQLLVIPTLVGGARMPVDEDLPEQLKRLSRRQAYTLSDERWNEDVSRLVRTLRPALGRRVIPRWTQIATAIAILLLCVAAFVPGVIDSYRARAVAERLKLEEAAKKLQEDLRAAETAAAERTAAKVATDRAAAEKVAADRKASEKDKADRVAAEKFASDRTTAKTIAVARSNAEKLKAENVARQAAALTTPKVGFKGKAIAFSFAESSARDAAIIKKRLESEGAKIACFQQISNDSSGGDIIYVNPQNILPVHEIADLFREYGYKLKIGTQHAFRWCDDGDGPQYSILILLGKR